MLAALALAIVAGVTVEVPPEACTSSTAVAAALAERVPADVPLRLTLTSTAGALRVEVGLPGAAPSIRRLHPSPGDCAILPQLLALIADRYLRALPRHTWAPRAPPRAPASSFHTTASTTPDARRPRYTLRVGGQGGPTVGLTGPGAGLFAEGLASVVGQHFGPGLGLGARVVPRVALPGGGTLTVTSAWLTCAGVVRADLGPARINGRVGLAAGFAVGEARGFEGASARATPSLESMIGADAALFDALFVGVELRARLVGPRFTGPDPNTGYESPALRGSLVLGMRRAVAFF